MRRGNNESTNQQKDSKSKFLEALEKKNRAVGTKSNEISRNVRVSRGQASGKTTRVFRRKSGSP